MNRLGEGTDLIDLQQQGVTGLLVNTGLDSGRVSDQQIVTDNLSVFTNTLSKVNVAFPVILIEGVLDRNNWIVVDESAVDIGQLSWGNIARLVIDITSVVILEICFQLDTIVKTERLTQVVFVQIGLPELRSGNVHGNTDFTGVSGSGNSFDNQIKSVGVDQNVWGKATLITNIDGILAELFLGN